MKNLTFEQLVQLQQLYEKLANDNLELIRFYQSVKKDNYDHNTGEGLMIGRSYQKFRDKSDMLKELIVIENDGN